MNSRFRGQWAKTRDSARFLSRGGGGKPDTQVGKGQHTSSFGVRYSGRWILADRWHGDLERLEGANYREKVEQGGLWQWQLDGCTSEAATEGPEEVPEG